VRRGEEVAQRDARWRRLVGTNPVVDGDLPCSGPTNDIGVMRGEAVTHPNLAGRARWGWTVRGGGGQKRSAAFEPGWSNGEKQGSGMARAKGRGERGGSVARARRMEGGLWTAGMAWARWRQLPVGRHPSKGGEGGGNLGAWAVMGPLAWADLNEQ
jgi:hypothetical protein